MDRSRRVRRRFGVDRGGLRRPVDRRQRAAGAGAAVLFAAVGPPASAVLAFDAYQTGVRAEHRPAHRATARIVRVESQDGAGLRHSYAELAWTPADGRPRSTVVPADRSARPGMGRSIWVDAAGDLTRRPRTRADTAARTAAAAALALSAAGLPPLAGYLAVRRRCDRRRDAMWDEALAALTDRETT